MRSRNFRRNQSERARGVLPFDHPYVFGGADGLTESEWEIHTVAYHADGNFYGILLTEIPVKGPTIPTIIIARRVGLTDTELTEVPLSSLPPVSFFSVDYFGAGFEATGRVFCNQAMNGWTLVVKRYAGMGRIPRYPRREMFAQSLQTNGFAIRGSELPYAGGIGTDQLAWKRVDTTLVRKHELIEHGITDGKSRIIGYKFNYATNAFNRRDVSMLPYDSHVRVAGDSYWYSTKFMDGTLQFKAMKYGTTGRWAGFGEGGFFFSENGLAWEAASNSPIGANCIEFGGSGSGFFIAGGIQALTPFGNSVAISDDGDTWTDYAAPQAFTCIRWVPWLDLFVACAEGIYTSPDGQTWTQRVASSGQFKSIAFTPSDATLPSVIIVGHDGGSGFPQIKQSVDGITWFTRTAPATGSWNNVEYGNGYFVAFRIDVAANASNAFMRSADGITWSGFSTAFTAEPRAMLFAMGMHIAAASAATGGLESILFSSDGGTTWNANLSPRGGGSIDGSFQSPIASDGTFICIASYNGDFDGQIWHTGKRFWDDTHLSLISDIGIFDEESFPASVYILHKQAAT